MISHLLDTNICIELIRGRSARVLAHLRQHEIRTIGLSSITLAELQFGVTCSSDPARNLFALAQFCAPLGVLPFDESAAAAYGVVRDKLERGGTPIGSLDMLIAAHAISLDLILVTNNGREFHRVAGLRIENWVRN